jgi:hypothetical protein
MLPFGAGQNLTHNCRVSCFVDMIDDDGSLLDHAEVFRDEFPAEQEATYMYTGLGLEEGQKRMQEIVNKLTSIGFRVVEHGPYWYNVRLERVWRDDSRYEVLFDIDSPEYQSIRAEQQRQGETRYQAEEERQGENRRAAHARQRETAQTEPSRRSASVWDTFADLVFLK